jgi:hypothetical protein
MQISTIGIDLAKTVFQIHAVDADGTTIIRKRLRRAEVLSFVSGLEPCLIGMEACATPHAGAVPFGQSACWFPFARVVQLTASGESVIASARVPRLTSTLVSPSKVRSFSAGTSMGPGDAAVPGAGCGKAVDIAVCNVTLPSTFCIN